MMESIEKLRESSHLDDSKWTLETGEVIHVYGSEPNDPNAVNWGEQWRKIADEIEAEIAERYMLLPCDADGVPIHVGDTVEFGENRNQGIVKAVNERMVIALHTDCDYTNYAKYGLLWSADACRHVKPRTIEDVLRELVEYVTNGTNVDSYEKDIASYADELRELMEVDR